ncbi:hypothetical protein ZWY2020_028008 [Hordeum vulgare]|nr:hypothetical protein ZWY2020_028008 [Hordeum vulgare]
MAPTAVGKEQRKFNYFVLVLQWQGTICSSTRHCRTINGCCRAGYIVSLSLHKLDAIGDQRSTRLLIWWSFSTSLLRNQSFKLITAASLFI